MFWRPNWRWLLMVAVVPAMSIWPVSHAADHAQAHEAPVFYQPAGFVKDIPVGEPIDQFHPDDHLAMLETALGTDWSEAHTEALVSDFGFPAVMVEVVKYESRHRPTAHRSTACPPSCPSGDYGLWQINWNTWGDHLLKTGVVKQAADLFLPRVNAEAAAVVLGQQGLRAWAVCQSWEGSGGTGQVRC